MSHPALHTTGSSSGLSVSLHQGLVQVTIQVIRRVHMLVVVLCRSFPDPLAAVRSLKHISFLISFPHVSFLSRRAPSLFVGRASS